MKHLLLAAAAASLAVPVLAQNATPIPSPGEIAAAAPASDWVAIAPSDMLVMDLALDAKGKPRRVVIQLMPAPFSQGWIGNIRKLAAAHWWDGTSVNRVQDNYVAQWGDATEKKPLPEGLAVVPESEYVLAGNAAFRFRRLIVEHKRDLMVDPYWHGGGYSFANGIPIALDDVRLSGLPDPNPARAWPVHCYGAVGVGRNLSPDTGSGAELYAVIGHAPRHLDQNIAIVGRVISGIEHLSSLPRGTGGLGFYENEAERVPIASIRIASDLPAADQPKFEYLSTDSVDFQRYADARANRRDAFFNVPAGGADICNIPVPVRPAK
jgi:peptidylprolyl isomerase